DAISDEPSHTDGISSCRDQGRDSAVSEAVETHALGLLVEGDPCGLHRPSESLPRVVVRRRASRLAGEDEALALPAPDLMLAEDALQLGAHADPPHTALRLRPRDDLTVAAELLVDADAVRFPVDVRPGQREQLRHASARVSGSGEERTPPLGRARDHVRDLLRPEHDHLASVPALRALPPSEPLRRGLDDPAPRD